MGMVLGLVALDDDSINKVLSDPPLVWKVLAPDDTDMYESELNANKNRSWFSRLFGKRQQPSEAKRIVEIGKPVEEIDLDKAWHGIHYMLAKTAWEGNPPLNFLLLGGENVGKINVGYGTARAFRSEAVKQIDSALAEMSEKDFHERFDPNDMLKLDIYPNIWTDNDSLSYCVEYFDDLKAFIRRIANKQLGMIVYIS